jgi:chromosome segregation protein
MHVDKIELIGFKSFAGKTTFHFHPGITCIVGPNGCGKSNIVDAFRWVLGEQSAKSLRGESMEEVIFNGSSTRKPKGMAEVTMVVSGINGAGQIAPADTFSGDNGESSHDTSSVTRRLYRSGDSEYLLNRVQCRLKDIKDIFLDTGLEVKSYSILEQDRIAAILNSKPQDRRFLIEEIAGVMKYNARKKEAQSKLEASRTNLQRINDIITEVKKQINLLDRLARKAERYKKLISEIHSIELKIRKMDFDSLKSSLELILAEYNSLRENETLRTAELTERENRIETQRLELLEREKALETLQSNCQNLERQIAEAEKTIAVSRTERDNLKEYLGKLHQQGAEFTEKTKGLLNRQAQLNESSRALMTDMEKQQELLSEKSEFLRFMEEEISGDEDALETRRRDVFRVSDDISNLRNSLNRIQSSLENLKRREGTTQQEIDVLRKATSDIETSMQDLERNLAEKKSGSSSLNEKKAILMSELTSGRKRAEELRERLSVLREEIASYVSRLESLKETVFDKATKELLSDISNLNLIASISDILEVDPEYEKALESALAEKVNSFILSSFDDIEAALSSIRGKGLGRTAFLPVNHPGFFLSQRGGEEKSQQCWDTDLPEGVIGKASDFIRTPEKYLQVMKRLFESVYIVRDIKTSRGLVENGCTMFLVTLDGEVIEPSGAVITGELKGVLKKKREIREIEKTILAKKDTMNSVQNELTALQQILERRESDFRGLEVSIVETEKEISLLRLTFENHREEQDRTGRKLAFLSTEIDQIVRDRETADILITEKDAEIMLLEARKSEIEQESAVLQEDIAQRKSRMNESQNEVTDIKLSMASLREKTEAVHRERKVITREIEEMEQKHEFLTSELSSVNDRISQRENELRESETSITSLVTEAEEMRRIIAERKEVVETASQERIISEQGLKVLRQDIAVLIQKIGELDVRKAEHNLKMQALKQGVLQDYSSDIEDIEIEPLAAGDEEKLADLRIKVQELGTVNLGTIEEYEELRTRYEFLTKQQDDLSKSIAELEEAITRINTTTRRKLKEAFDALKAKFSEVFSILFGGGRADLIMTDESSILDTGLDITAQPPGKKLQNINLLSGGEKALTALSLLFASFLIKPTPLCILDEADADLDESNTERFSQMVRELSKETQFIVVTHKRTTISAADNIYGITMEEAGISKVISMQLVDAAVEAL